MDELTEGHRYQLVVDTPEGSTEIVTFPNVEYLGERQVWSPTSGIVSTAEPVRVFSTRAGAPQIVVLFGDDHAEARLLSS